VKEITSEPNASALISSTRSIGYSFESAVADIIDNSITAQAKNIWIYSPPSDNPSLAIIDDGHGMNESKLREAMRYGLNPSDERRLDDLGRFGLGMKIASLSQCRKLTVISKSIGCEIVAFRWDLDKVIRDNNWTLLMLEENEISNLEIISKLKSLQSGTIVLWENLDRVTDKTKEIKDCIADHLIITREHIAMTFHRFMDEEALPNKLNMFVNGSIVEPADPFLTHHPTTEKLPEQTINIAGNQIKLKPFVLPPVSKLSPADSKLIGGKEQLRRLQGFYVYRNKRLILPGTWFKLTSSKELRKLARVRVDIPNTLDFIWDIDIKKSSATLPPQLRNNFVQILPNVIARSEKIHNFGGRNINDMGKTYVWNKLEQRDQYQYVLNRHHPILQNLLSEINEDSKRDLENFLRIIESSVPFTSIYNDISSAKNISTDMTDEEHDQLLALGIELSKSIGITLLEKTEPYCNNPKIIEKIKEYEVR